MIRHIVWWTLKPEASGRKATKNTALIKETAEKLITFGIPGLRSIEVSINPLPSCTQPADVVLFSTHDDLDSLGIYAEHPEHCKLVAIIKEVTSSRQAMDYAI